MEQYRKIILASGSPRRKELLSAAGLEFEVIKSAEDENITETAPDRIVMDLAKKKAESVARSLPAAPDGKIPTSDSLSGQRSGTLVIGADTIVVLDKNVLGKPRDKKEALTMLMSLSGRVHQVFTGVCVLELSENMPETVDGKAAVPDTALLFAEETQVEMEPFNKETALSFIETGIPMDKAGAYAIQGLGSLLVRGIVGDFHNVMGFPLGSFLRKGIAKGWFRI